MDGMFEVGRMCLKTAGREAGKYCVVIKNMEDNFVMVTGPKSATQVKRRRCNTEHLEPLTEKIKISADASDSEVLAAYEKEGIYAKLDIGKPDQSKIKAMKEEKEKRKASSKPRPEKKERKGGGKPKGHEPAKAKAAEKKPAEKKAPKKKASAKPKAKKK